MVWSKMIDLELTAEDVAETMPSMPFDLPRPDKKRFPYGMVLRLDQKTLDKLGLDCDCDEGDMIDMRCFGEVIVVHKEDGQNSVSIQITKIQVEDESEETPGED